MALPFNSLGDENDLFADWWRDADRRRRVPPAVAAAGRGTLGLAALFADVDAGVCHGLDKVLYPNDAVRWLCLRDVPPGRFPRCPVRDRRGAAYATEAAGSLRHGRPRLDFARPCRDAVDLLLPPRRPARPGPRRGAWGGPADEEPAGDALDGGRRPAALAALTRASAAMTRAAFAGVGPGGALRPAWFALRPRGERPFRPPPPAAWMPRPYLAFDPPEAARLAAWLATPAGWAAAAAAGGGAGPRIASDGRLTLTVPDRTTYLGAAAVGRPEADGPVIHRFTGAGGEAAVRLPPAARPLVAPGTPLEPGDPWCAGPAGDARARRAWADAQGLTPGHLARAGRVLYPASLAAGSPPGGRAAGLWWDFGPATPYVSNGPAADVAAFPPVPLRRWDALRLDLCGVDVDAGIGDPRFVDVPVAGRQPRRPPATPERVGDGRAARRGPVCGVA